MSSSEDLLSLQPFQPGIPTGFASAADIKNAYDRARLICQHHALSLQDILTLSPKFWHFHLDTIHAAANNCLVLLTTHLNLCIGTLGSYLKDRPDLAPLIEKLLKFEINGQYLLTEVGWGVDADELKTTATMQPDGTFDLHTPYQQAAKFMSPTTPDAGMPSGAIIFARLIVDAEDRGVRPFWVLLHDSEQMEEGVISYALPKRAGTQPTDHAVTFFNHKRLAKHSLLGSLEKPTDPAAHFAQIVSRASIGTLSISTVNVPCLKLCTYIAAKYSARRTVTGPAPNPTQTPILTYRTQHGPILHALAQSLVWTAASHHTAALFSAATTPPALKPALAIPFKTAIQHQTQATLGLLSARCGAQGLYEHNAIISCQHLMRGNSFAEGDVVVVAIRLVSDLLAHPDRHPLPPPLAFPDAPLARLAAGLLAEARRVHDALLPGDGGAADEAAFNAKVLPLCEGVARAIGCASAHDAARRAGVAGDVLDVFEAGCVRGEWESWFVEEMGWGRGEVAEREERALGRLYGRLDELVEGLGVGAYARVPLMTEGAWEGFVRGLPRFERGG
ncbi:acyl-dehydrogenase nm domain-like protein [Diplodia corticola]|uniref:Acyl-dehydrogenase nm domain-like protein n=1 Tax=Diplodia corticola TaxID=236234 RepID=A0A1J9R543_9PEZI|nr:acyl-dehydrogenase nm domain-like protein [Diplodia corticola]OJD36606.1 acyl-dehydrogenase nm domain-like protein [Diplodia corticola]